MGYGGAWVGGHEFGLAIESLPCHLLARPTPSFKPMPMGATPKTHAQPKSPEWWLGRFQPTHTPTQAPYRMTLLQASFIHHIAALF
ncbi:hypothetical protein HanXRQr2_Chr05g0225451 [Helianthus annuus]|uniref:Uncharacterized protein n=1 Tax=Helianthus annuus TaxID=4232 RepID=A0A9K3NN47_HELAN|nr:hypothetical protein HanXRQr2_Chr05g0225451 [Helianthus annuus]KAJ0923567.1 hypothetical protein HanPSC8_Chr05g0217471 [Helianthus annuus]